MTTELVIFDCDGVLVDSEAIVIEIESELLTAAGFAISPDEIADRFVGMNHRDMMAQLRRDFGRPVPAQLNERIQREALAAFADRLQPVRGVPELLAGLDVARCVGSSSDLDRIQLSLDVTGLTPHFAPEHVFSAQMVERGKPAPDLFLHAARELGVDPGGCLVIEDSPHGVTAARHAGMRVVGLVAGLHARPSLADRLRAAGAETVCETAAEITCHL